MWEGFPPEFASWEPEGSIHDNFIDEFEATIEAAAQLRAEEEAAEIEDNIDDECVTSPDILLLTCNYF